MGRTKRLLDRIWSPRAVRDAPQSKGDTVITSMVDHLLKEPGGDPRDTAQQAAALDRAELAASRGDVVAEEVAILEGYWLANYRGKQAMGLFKEALNYRRAQGTLRRGVFFGMAGPVLFWSDRISAAHGAVCPVDANLHVHVRPADNSLAATTFSNRDGSTVRGAPPDAGKSRQAASADPGSLYVTIEHPLASGVLATDPVNEAETREVIAKTEAAIVASGDG